MRRLIAALTWPWRRLAELDRELEELDRKISACHALGEDTRALVQELYVGPEVPRV